MQVSHEYMVLHLYACFKAPKRKWFNMKPCWISVVVVWCDGISRLACCFEDFCSFVGEHILQETCWGKSDWQGSTILNFRPAPPCRRWAGFVWLHISDQKWSRMWSQVNQSNAPPHAPPPTTKILFWWETEVTTVKPSCRCWWASEELSIGVDLVKEWMWVESKMSVMLPSCAHKRSGCKEFNQSLRV